MYADGEGGDAEACFMIASAYDFGWHNLKVDPLVASVYYDDACDGNHAKACFMLALLYLDGNGVKKDPAVADELFREARDLADKSCRLGDKEACDLKVADAAAPQSKPAVAAADRPANTSCKIARVQLGVDTVASVERDIQARGGSPSGGGGPFKHRVTALSGDYADGGPGVMAVSYDFDAAGPAGRLMAVTIVNHANTGPDFEALLASRKAAAAAIAGPLQPKSEAELVASSPGCQLRLLPNGGVQFSSAMPVQFSSFSSVVGEAIVADI